MAILFEKTVDGVHYKVTQAGQSIRLYSDGVFHSQYNDRTIVSGAVWDLLLLPAFMLPNPPSNSLVLGVGGGAVMRMLAYFIPNISVTGLDLNPIHIQLAKQFFGLNQTQFTLICEDAKTWVSKLNPSHQFDLIIDDVFRGDNGDPKRPYAIDPAWLTILLAKLSHNGGLVFNFDRKAQANQFAKMIKSNDLLAKGDKLWMLDCPGYENRIIAICRTGLDKALFYERLQSERILDTRLSSCRLNFALHKL